MGVSSSAVDRVQSSVAHPGYRSLTRRQREVGRCVIVGMGRQEIASELGISPRTVDTHRLAVFAKLGCGTEIELVWRAFEIGWLK